MRYRCWMSPRTNSNVTIGGAAEILLNKCTILNIKVYVGWMLVRTRYSKGEAEFCRWTVPPSVIQYIWQNLCDPHILCPVSTLPLCPYLLMSTDSSGISCVHFMFLFDIQVKEKTSFVSANTPSEAMKWDSHKYESPFFLTIFHNIVTFSLAVTMCNLKMVDTWQGSV